MAAMLTPATPTDNEYLRSAIAIFSSSTATRLRFLVRTTASRGTPPALHLSRDIPAHFSQQVAATMVPERILRMEFMGWECIRPGLGAPPTSPQCGSTPTIG